MAQIKVLEMETTIPKMKTIHGRVTAEQTLQKNRLGHFEYRTTETFQNETQRTKSQNQISRVSVNCGTISNGLRYK